MKKIILLYFLIACLIGVNAQVVNLGSPIGWKGKLNLNNLQIIKMVGYNQAVIDKQDFINDKAKDRPWRFGYKYDVSFNLENSGRWTILPNGDRVWQLLVHCEGALSVNFLFENFNIPKGAYLHIYDYNKTNRVGAYTFKNNREDGALGTEIVQGEKVIIEYVEPLNVIGQGRFSITNVVHGYRSIGPIQDSLSKALNSSGDCNIDVNCPLGDGWENEIRSVAMIVVGGNGICTGALINNTCNDGTPYFLTAEHCLGSGTGSWAFRFNWESPPGTESCATTTGSTDPGAPYDQTANGATTLVSGTVADFALLELDNMTLSDAQNWNCFYAGWDATDLTTVTQATGIHHPSGDLKKICREDDSPFHSNAAGAAVWYIEEWEEGVTEPGSSGSPLFDQNHRIIGQLYGGLAACSGIVNNNEYDYYGRLGISWNNGVSDYLAPNSCGESTVNDGWDPNAPSLSDDVGVSGISSPTGGYCVDNFVPEITLRNYGTNNLNSVTINYNIDGDNNSYYNWTGNLESGGSELITLPELITTSGSHTFNAFTSSPNGNSDSNPNNDALSSSYIATIGGQDILVELNTDCWGSEVTWTIQDENFNIFASGGPYEDTVVGEYISENLCLALGCYNFIINDTYGDGMFGSQWENCDVDGSYTITNLTSGRILAEVLADSADYGDQEINNFCIEQEEICSIDFSTSFTNPQCLGLENGSIIVSVNGSDQSYDFQWNNNLGNSAELYDLSPGEYILNISDSMMCDTNISFNLDYLTLLELSLSVNNALCHESNDGSVVAQITGGPSDYNYLWNNGETTSQINNLYSGTYSVVVTDANNCVVDGEATISSPEDLVMDFLVYNNVCPNQNNGSILGGVSGGVFPYDYQWNNGENTQNIVNLFAGDYSLSVTDSNGCSIDTLFNVLSGAGPETSAITGFNEVSLFTEHQYSISQTQNSFYNWNVVNGNIVSNQVNSSITVQWENVGLGVVNVIETDSNGCVGDTISLIVSVLDSCAIDPLEISFTIIDANCGIDNGAVETNVIGGNGFYNYLWSNSATSSEISDLSVGVYSLTVTDSNNCSSTEYVNVSSSFAPEITIFSEDVSCYGLNDGNAEVFVQGGVAPYIFQWSNGSTDSIISNLTSNQYIVTVTDADDCSVSDLVNISSPDQLIMNFNVVDVICPADNTGSIEGLVVGGTTPYVYQWSNDENNPNIANLEAGDYFLTVSDSNGCTVDSLFIVGSNEGPQISNVIGLDQVFINDSVQYYVSQTTSSYYIWEVINGSIINGQGTNAVTIHWNNIGNGSLSVFETSALGCISDTINLPISILDPCSISPIDVSSNPVNASCGYDNGSISVNVIGGNGTYSYAWSNGETTSEINNLSAGDYSVLVNDELDCQVSLSVNLVAYESPTLAVFSQDVSCFGFSDGSASVDVNGQTGPYNYAWSNGELSSAIYNLNEGEYSVSVTDTNGCSVDGLVNIFAPEQLVMNYYTSEFNCPGQNTGFIQGEVIGGTSPYYFQWSNGETTTELQYLSVGEYNLIVTDFNGCITDSVFNIVNGEVIQTGNIIGQNQVIQFSSKQYFVSQNLGSTYFWFAENGAIATGQGSNMVTVQWGSNGVGQLSVVETHLNGCQGDTVNTTVSIGNTGIWSNNNYDLIKVYPNPTNGLVNIEVENYSGTIYTKVYDMIGNLVISTNKNSIDTQYFSKGVYLLEVSFDGKLKDLRLIKD